MKTTCKLCGGDIYKSSKFCRSCNLKVRNKTNKQRKAVSTYWKGKFRDKWLERWINEEPKQLKKQDVSQLNGTWIKLLAWIITDGSIRKRWGKIVIYQKKEKYKKIIKAILHSLNLQFNEYISKRDGTSMFYIFSKDSKKIIDTLCLRTKKEIPDWCYFMNIYQINTFLNSLIDGDGTRRKYDTTLFGTKEMLGQIFHLLIDKDIGCTLNQNNRGDWYIQIHQKNARSK